jgi:hypothetical protein
VKKTTFLTNLCYYCKKNRQPINFKFADCTTGSLQQQQGGWGLFGGFPLTTLSSGIKPHLATPLFTLL